jgi:tyrosinase
MSTRPFLTTGVPTAPGPNGALPIRREIRDLEKNYPLEWNLLLLGLNSFQDISEDDQLSFYQISGIHGLPYQPWNGVAGLGSQQTGYCTHSSILFLPWHRPYLALYEQLLCNIIQNLASKFSPALRPQYVAAAQDFRLPYWDWGLLRGPGQNTLPDAVSGPLNVVVTGTDGNPTTIPNPFYQYQFDPNLVAQDFPDQPFASWSTTKRYPDSDSPDAQSQPDQLNAAINSQAKTIRSMVRYILSAIKDFPAFSNTEWVPGNAGEYASLEDIHDNIHGLTGGPTPGSQGSPPGNMSIIPYAAFDPVFWLHHCNVDRLFAIWQALYPNSYVQPEPSTYGTYTTLPGTIENASSSLTPFWHHASTFHTPETARSTKNFGYAYPETQSWNFQTASDYQKSVRAAVSSLYGATITRPRGLPIRSLAAVPAAAPAAASAAGGSVRENVAREDAPRDVVKETKAEEKTSFTEKVEETFGFRSDASKKPEPRNPRNPGTEHDDLHKILAPGGKYKEWITNIRVPKHGLGGSFQVHIFIRDVPPDHSSWVVHDNNVGTYAVLGSDRQTTGCEKCQSDADRELIVTGIIILTEALIDRVTAGELRSLTPEDVVPYLKENLHWRITLADGTHKPNEEVRGLKISVVSTDVDLPDDPHELPQYSGHYTIHPEITEGEPGGSNRDDPI